MTTSVAAVDLGATSGRVMIGHVGPDELRLDEVTRFPNGPVAHADGLHWGYSGLRRHIEEGLRAAGARSRPESIGIDSWAVDYGLLRDGALIAEPFHYRDDRTAAGVTSVHSAVPFESLYRRNGLQFLPFNTVYQLAVDRNAGRLADVDRLLLIPDLVAYELTGRAHAEITNASTTGLLDRSGEWDVALADSLAIPARLLPPIAQPGTRIGPLLPEVANRLGFHAPVTAIGSHDTASAVVATPMTQPDAAYISCGTWGLVGVELDEPLITNAGRDANFTNERGVDGRVRFLRNVMGLWLLNESVTTWQQQGRHISLTGVLAQAADVDRQVPLFDVDDPRFSAPGDMPARIADYCREHGLAVPEDPPAVTRSIVESLADAFARTVRDASELSGKSVGVIHLVGGGALNDLLCQRTADRSGLPVIAGPVEATALGNVLIQARATGAVSGTLESLRDLVARTVRLRRDEPSADRCDRSRAGYGHSREARRPGAS